MYLTSEACINYTCNQNPCATATCNMQRVQQQRLQLAARAAHTYEINHNNRHCPSATDSLKCWARHRKPHTRTHTEQTHTHTLASSLRFWITSSYICGLLGNLLDYHCGLRPTHAGWEAGRNRPTGPSTNRKQLSVWLPLINIIKVGQLNTSDKKIILQSARLSRCQCQSAWE